MAFPIKLTKDEGVRRMALLKDIDRLGAVTMDAMVSPTECNDLRWLWEKDLLRVISAGPLTYVLTLTGKKALEQLPEELAKLASKGEHIEIRNRKEVRAA